MLSDPSDIIGHLFKRIVHSLAQISVTRLYMHAYWYTCIYTYTSARARGGGRTGRACIVSHPSMSYVSCCIALCTSCFVCCGPDLFICPASPKHKTCTVGVKLFGKRGRKQTFSPQRRVFGEHVFEARRPAERNGNPPVCLAGSGRTGRKGSTRPRESLTSRGTKGVPRKGV